jgi:glutaredoxin
MENQNQAGQDLSKLKSMFQDYQKKQSQSSGRKLGKDLLAKYFVPRKSKEVFRILPPKAGRKHIEEAFFHVVTTNIAGGKKKHGTVIYCPAHNDPAVPKLGPDGKPLMDSNGTPLMVHAPCPLCAKHKALLATQDPSLKGIKKENMNDMQLVVKAKNDEIYKEAIKYEAKKFYIVRGIDKGMEKDGVKFWRFKHNYKNQGTLDKLLPILEDYMTSQKADFSDPNNGTDLNIIMTDSEFNGHVYKAISAITAKGKSKLHEDPQVMEVWLNDDITWRDVFLPKKAPNTTPYEYLEMVAKNQNPYWEDTDQNNKHWVFPGRPDLEEKANTRTMNLDVKDENFEQASDLEIITKPQVNISNVTEQNVGTYDDDATDLGKETLAKTPNESTTSTESTTEQENNDVDNNDYEDDSTDSTDYDDLPF